MWRMIVIWLLSAVAFMIVARAVPGYSATGTLPSAITALGIGFLNAILGVAIKDIHFPIVLILFAIFLVFINAACIMAASRLVDGFDVYGWTPTVWGGVVMTGIGMTVRMTMKNE
jgi:uncharacterized membrane protein YvlD (DUF360 family)